MTDLFLVVNGRRYGGWKSIRVTRSIESLAGSFALDVSDRWGNDELWPIAEEDACRVEIGKTTVISGYIDKRNPTAAKETRTLAYTGRDRAGALVDNSALLDKWTFYNVNVVDFAKKLAAPFGVGVTVQAGLTLAKVPKLVVSPGDTAYEAIKRAVSDQGVLLVSDGAGGIVITRVGTERATSLVMGSNIHTASAEYDGTERYYRYVVVAQTAGTDEAAGDATRIQAEAIDPGVRRTDRVLLIRPDRQHTVAQARARADWEARTRAARAEPVSISVLGWEQPNGQLWKPNTISRVRAQHSIGVDGDMVITQVEYSIGDGGQITQLRLMRPDAFTPEPVVAQVKTSGGAWKELAKGAL